MHLQSGGGGAASLGTCIRCKHTRIGPKETAQRQEPSSTAKRDANEHDLPANHAGSVRFDSLERSGQDDMTDFIMNSDVQEFMAFLAAEGQLRFEPAIVPAILDRIAVLHPPTTTGKQSSAHNSREDVGSLVRAVLGHVHTRLGTIEAELLADILTSTGKLVHLQGMRFWFSNGGAGGLGTKTLLTLVAKAGDLPPACVANVIGSLGRLGSGEQGQAAMGHGLGQRALAVVHLWDADMLLEALHGLVLLQRAAHSKAARGQRLPPPEEEEHASASGLKARRPSAPDRGMVGRLMSAILEECEGKMQIMSMPQLHAVMAGLSCGVSARRKAAFGGAHQVSSSLRTARMWSR